MKSLQTLVLGLLFLANQLFANANYRAAHGHFAEKSWDASTIFVIALLVVPIASVFFYALYQYIRGSEKHKA